MSRRITNQFLKKTLLIDFYDEKHSHDPINHKQKVFRTFGILNDYTALHRVWYVSARYPSSMFSHIIFICLCFIIQSREHAGLHVCEVENFIGISE